jgi:hypothetical protein
MPTLKRHLHPCSTVPTVSISADEAALLVALLRPRASLLAELLELQVQHCPQGCSDWADTADALAVANSAMHKLHNAQLEIARRG